MRRPLRALAAALFVATALASGRGLAQDRAWHWLVAPRPVLGVERIAASDPAHVRALAAGRVYRLVGTAWRPATGREATWRETAAMLPRDLPVGAPFAPVAAVRDARGRTVALGPRGELAAWRRDRSQMEERSTPHGTGAFFVPARAGWATVGRGAAGPREPVALALARDVVLVAGRDGALARIEWNELGEACAPLVSVPYPRVLALVPARDGSLLVVTDSGVVRTGPSGTRPVVLAPESVAALARVRAESASRLVAIPLGADGALVAYRYDAFLVAGVRAEPVAITPESAQTGEIWALQALDAARWIALTHIGRVFRGDGARSSVAGALTDVPGPDVPHPLGAFRGADARVRLVDHARTVACVGASGPVVACGPVLTVEPRAVHPLDDGIAVETQQIRTVVVSTDGSREVASPSAGARTTVFAGTARAPLALADRTVLALRAASWEQLAEVPTACEPQALAATAAAIYVGCAGGAVAELPRAPGRP